LTEPRITINGRLLTEGQAMAVRVAIAAYHQELQDPDHLGTDRDGRRLTHAYRDRLEEVLRFILPAAASKEPVRLTEAQRQRANRILQLAGIVPETAAPSAMALAVGYAGQNIQVDEAAVRLRRAMESGSC
jgi:hypothetical protein